jgi:carboxypeptidase PM20D1
MRKLPLIVLILAVGMAGVVSYRAMRLTGYQPAPGTAPRIDLDVQQATERLAGAVRFRTVSMDDPATNEWDQWLQLHAYLAATFPRVTETMRRETVGSYSLLYTWTGAHPDLAPLILMAHLDVVPASESAGATWTHPPFDGRIAGGSIWGRGTLDDKAGVTGQLEAAEALLAQGFVPDRTIYFAFGCNEEAGGPDSGAARIAQLLASRRVHDAVLLDEGGWIFDGIPGVRRHVALIGIAEKGFANIELSVTSAGGHSSMPPKETVIGILARAIDRVEKTPMPARLDGGTAQLFDTLAPDMSFGMRAIFANLWLTRPLVLRRLAQQPTTNAGIRTTMAPTIVSGGDKDNVLASSARAVVNVRLLPGDTADEVMAHIRNAIDDARVDVHRYRGEAGTGASAVSRTDTALFAALGGAIRAVYPDVLVAPYISVGATDARHYAAVAPSRYRFVPIDQPGGTELLHAPNEHLEMAAYDKAIHAYAAIITALAHAPGDVR